MQNVGSKSNRTEGKQTIFRKGNFNSLIFYFLAVFLGVLLNFKLVAADIIYVVEPINDIKILPDTALPDSLQSKSISITACPGEFEPASFVLKPDSNVTDLSVTASSLTIVGGATTIPAANVDVRVVKCWYQSGYIGRDVENKHLTPELLLKDDSLVDVDFVNEENYLKMTPDGDDPYYECISTEGNEMGIVILSFEDFPVQDTATLQNVDILSGENKQFWITLKVPDAATPGIYTGTITLSAAGVNETINLRVFVPNITLLAPSIEYSLYTRSKLKATGSISSDEKNEDQFRFEMRNLAEHGISSPVIPYLDSYEHNTFLDPIMEIREEEGIDNTNIYYEGLRTYHENIASSVTSVKGFLSSNYGTQDLYVYSIDEGYLNTETIRSQITAIQQVGGKVFCAQRPTYAVDIDDILDVAVVCYGTHPVVADLYHDSGNKVFKYGSPQVAEERPEIHRRIYGLNLWKANYDGAMNYAYQHSFGNIWNDFDSLSREIRDYALVYPTMDGVIDTIQWEGVREGVDDVRYVTTLEDAIGTVLAGGNEDLKKIARDAQSWLTKLKKANFPYETIVNITNVDKNPIPDLNQARLKVIDYILRLQGDGGTALVGRWRMDESTGSTAYDCSGYGNDGTLTNMVSAWVAGKSSGGLDFDGADDYVECGNDASLDIRNQITFMAWVKIDSTAGKPQLAYCNSSSGPRYVLSVNDDNKTTLYVSTDNESYHLGGKGSAHTWTDGWHHIAWTYNSGTNMTKLYFDGSEDYSSDTVSTGLLKSGTLSFLRIGGSKAGLFFDGTIDDARIYNQALSTDEIKSAYNEGSLCGKWTFNDGSGSLFAQDVSGNGNVGTLNNMTSSAWVAGKSAGGLDFDGADDYVECGDDASLDIRDRITFMAWVKINSTAGKPQLAYCDSSSGPRYVLSVNDDNKTTLYVSTDNESYHLGGKGSAHTWTDGWHHIAWTYDSGTNMTKLYFDGTEDYSSDAVSTGLLKNGTLSFLRIGGGKAGLFFDGTIDDARIYNQALSADEIKSVCVEGSLCGKWTFNEKIDSGYVQDLSGNNNTGTMFAAVPESNGGLFIMDPFISRTAGISDGGMTFDESNNEYIDCGNDESLNITEAITVTAWVKIASTADSPQIIYSATSVGQQFRLSVDSSNKINLCVRTVNEGWHTGTIGDTAHTWTDGWHHVAWTYDSSTNTTKLYFDGTEDYSSTTQNTGPLVSGTLSFVKLGGGENGKYFDGDLDDVRVYNKALSSTEITAVMNSPE